MRKLFYALLLISLSYNTILAQSTNKDLAYSKGKEAITLMDNGEFEKSIALLEEAQKLDPNNIIYPYEIGYAYYAMKDYEKAIKQGESLLNHKEIMDQVYQILGNSYDLNGDPEKAIATYKEGLIKFPNSGNLHLELGNMYLMKEEYDKAAEYYENGIIVDPMFSSNYYWASKLYCSSSNEVYGMIYGEIFLNLEPSTKRTAEISNMLYDTYVSEIKFEGDTSIIVDFNNNVIQEEDLKGKKKNKLPFGLQVYGPTLLMSIYFSGQKEINLTSLDQIRTIFIEQYYKQNYQKEYPIVVFEYQNKLKKAGHLSAYNHWLLRNGDPNAFEVWRMSHKKEWEGFIDWFNANRMEITAKNQYYSSKY